MKILLSLSSIILFTYCIASSACIHTLVDMQSASHAKLIEAQSQIDILKILQHSPKELSEIDI